MYVNTFGFIMLSQQEGFYNIFNQHSMLARMIANIQCWLKKFKFISDIQCQIRLILYLIMLESTGIVSYTYAGFIIYIAHSTSVLDALTLIINKRRYTEDTETNWSSASTLI